MNCKYCGKPLAEIRVKDKGLDYCADCETKLLLVRRFVLVCDELKRRIGYKPKKEAKR